MIKIFKSRVNIGVSDYICCAYTPPIIIMISENNNDRIYKRVWSN